MSERDSDWLSGERYLVARRLSVLLVLSGLFLGTLAMLNILGISRFICLASWGPEVEGEASFWVWGQPNFLSNINFVLAVGVLPYPLTFLCTDLISEFFGRKWANRVVLIGLLLNLWVMAILWLGGVLPGFDPLDAVTGMPAQPEWDAEKQVYAENGWTFFQIRHLAFGAVMASMVAYLMAQLVDVHVFHWVKKKTQGRYLWLRNNSSTLVSQLVDTVAVILVTHFYAHALPVDAEAAIWPQLGLLIATVYVFKLVVALVDTPLIYAAVWGLKRFLKLDPIAAQA